MSVDVSELVGERVDVEGDDDQWVLEEIGVGIPDPEWDGDKLTLGGAPYDLLRRGEKLWVASRSSWVVDDGEEDTFETIEGDCPTQDGEYETAYCPYCGGPAESDYGSRAVCKRSGNGFYIE